MVEAAYPVIIFRRDRNDTAQCIFESDWFLSPCESRVWPFERSMYFDHESNHLLMGVPDLAGQIDERLQLRYNIPISRLTLD